MLSKDEKTNIITEYHTHETDTGSPEVQVALLTTRINQLTGHLNTHKHDQSSRQDCCAWWGSAAVTAYLARTNPQYRELLGRLGCASSFKLGVSRSNEASRCRSLSSTRLVLLSGREMESRYWSEQQSMSAFLQSLTSSAPNLWRFKHERSTTIFDDRRS
jgi:small subunit ribosomal protein S15